MKEDTIEDYINKLSVERQEPIKSLLDTVRKNLPEGFSETISYGMIGFVVPHATYPNGYHCNPSLPLPFISLASQKNFIALYHIGLYADTELLKWFTNEYPKYCKSKLDMGKSCIRFKKPDHIPFELIGELCKKISPIQWIEIYETNLKR